MSNESKPTDLDALELARAKWLTSPDESVLENLGGYHDALRCAAPAMIAELRAARVAALPTRRHSDEAWRVKVDALEAELRAARERIAELEALGPDEKGGLVMTSQLQAALAAVERLPELCRAMVTMGAIETPKTMLRQLEESSAGFATIRATLELLLSHRLDADWRGSMPSRICQDTLSEFSQLGAYYIGRRCAWEEVQHVLANPPASVVAGGATTPEATKGADE